MTQTLEAVYDGSVIHPNEPVQLEANTRIRIIIESLPEADPQLGKTGKPHSFLDAALAANLEGFPSDYSANIDHYLYGVEKVQETAHDE